MKKLIKNVDYQKMLSETITGSNKTIFDQLIANTVIGIFLLDRKSEITLWNLFMEKITGFKSEEVIGRTPEGIFQFLSNTELITAFEKAMAGETVSIQGIPLNPAAGESEVFISLTYSPVRNNENEITGVLGIAQNITDWKKTDEKMELAQFAMDKAPDSILWIGDSGDIVYANETACSSMGYNKKELLGKKVFEIDPDFPESGWETHKKIMKHQGRMKFESRHLRKDGSDFPVEVTSNCLDFDNNFLACAFDRDISERKKAEEILARSESAYREIFNQVQDAIYIHDIDNFGIIDVNNSTLELFGYTVEEFKVLNVGNISSGYPPYTKENAEKLIKRAAAGEKLHFEWQCRRKKGELFWTEVSLKKGTINGKERIFAIERDITERKKIEEEKEKIYAQLIQAQKMDSIGRLAGGVAHDFNNMLSVILGHTELAVSALGKDDPLLYNLREISKAAEHSAELTKKLLAFARKQVVVPEIVDLNITLESMLSILKRLIGENITLLWEPAENLWLTRMDPSQINQIMTNLCINARDAIDGIGKITIKTENRIADDSYIAGNPGFMPGEYVLITVSDNGCGMGRETLSKLFEPFYTTKETGKGSGLGLATVYGIVKQNNGFINVYSEPGHGSLFSIYIPRYYGKKEKAPKDGEVSGHQSRCCETILLVEDEQAILEMIRAMLEKQGYKIYAASLPSEALAIAGKLADEIDLLLTDVIMPEMNGRDLAESITGICPGIKTLFMSGYTTDIIMHHGMIGSDINFINKPFTFNDLSGKIRLLLDKTNE